MHGQPSLLTHACPMMMNHLPSVVTHSKTTEFGGFRPKMGHHRSTISENDQCVHVTSQSHLQWTTMGALVFRVM